MAGVAMAGVAMMGLLSRIWEELMGSLNVWEELMGSGNVWEEGREEGWEEGRGEGREEGREDRQEACEAVKDRELCWPTVSKLFSSSSPSTCWLSSSENSARAATERMRGAERAPNDMLRIKEELRGGERFDSKAKTRCLLSPKSSTNGQSSMNCSDHSPKKLH